MYMRLAQLTTREPVKYVGTYWNVSLERNSNKQKELASLSHLSFPSISTVDPDY